MQQFFQVDVDITPAKRARTCDPLNATESVVLPTTTVPSGSCTLQSQFPPETQLLPPPSPEPVPDPLLVIDTASDSEDSAAPPSPPPQSPPQPVPNGTDDSNIPNRVGDYPVDPEPNEDLLETIHNFQAMMTAEGAEETEFCCVVGEVGRVVQEQISTEASKLEEQEQELNSEAVEGSTFKLGAVIILILMFVIRFKLPDESANVLLELIQFIMPSCNILPRSLYMLRKLMKTYVKLPTITHFCAFCYTHVNKNLETCSNPLCSKDLRKPGALAYFVLHDLSSQISRFFEKEQFCKEVRNHRFQHYKKKKKCSSMSDVYDGTNYKNLFNNDGFLAQKNNLSFTMNTDGVPVFSSSKIQMWPVYLMVNELPIAQRKLKENLLLYGIWIGVNKPMMWSYLKPLKEQMSTLYEGISCTDSEGKDMTTHAVILSCVCDLPAKSLVCNNTQFNGKFGCWYCEQQGKSWLTVKGHTTIFPFDKDNHKGPARTPETIKRDADIASEKIRGGKKNVSEKGIKGNGWFQYMERFNLVNGMVVDPMHCLYAGVTTLLMNIWFGKEIPGAKPGTRYYAKIPIIDALLDKIKPLQNLSRVPRSLLDLPHWKSSEFRNFLLYWGKPILKNILSDEHFGHFCLLVRAIHNLSKEVIEEEDLLIAEQCLVMFVANFAGLYGGRFMTMNIHSLLHLVDSVRANGPLFVNNCFVFEDLNGYLLDHIHGTLGVDTQLVNTIALLQSAPILKEKFIVDDQLQFMYDRIASCYLHKGVTVAEGVFLGSTMDTRRLTELEKDAIFVNFDVEVETVKRFKRVYIKSLNSNLCATSYTKLAKRDQSHIKYFVLDGTKKFGLVKDFVMLHNSNGVELPVIFVKPVGKVENDSVKHHDITGYKDVPLQLIAFEQVLNLVQLVKTDTAETVVDFLNTYDVD